MGLEQFESYAMEKARLAHEEKKVKSEAEAKAKVAEVKKETKNVSDVDNAKVALDQAKKA